MTGSVTATGLGLDTRREGGDIKQELQVRRVRYDGQTVAGDPSMSAGMAVMSFLQALWDVTEGKRWGWRAEPELQTQENFRTRDQVYLMRARVYWEVDDDTLDFSKDVADNIETVFGKEVADKYRERHGES